MDLDDKNAARSVTGGFLRAAGTGMLIVCLAFAAKAAFGGAAMAVDHLVTAALAGAVGTAAMMGAAVADRECRKPEDEDTADSCRAAASSGARGPVVEVESSEQCERRFATRLNRQRGQGPGRCM